jgi:phenylalanyl-tRNA synthetase beta chain
MPTLSYSKEDVSNYFELDKLDELAKYAKCEIELDNENNQVIFEFGDTNLPFVWSLENFALLVGNILKAKKVKGHRERKIVKEIQIKKPIGDIVVDKSLKDIRPYVVGFMAETKEGISEEFILELVQLQEKLSDSFGKKRERNAVGIYKGDLIKFPINYTTKDPSFEFIPLEYKVPLSLKDILNEHEKGKEYKKLVEKFDKYPILIDKSKKVLSFPPIINSNDVGRIEPGDKKLFVESTGLNIEEVMLVGNILMKTFELKGFEVSPVTIKYAYDVEIEQENKNIKTKKLSLPFSPKNFIYISEKDVEDLIGIELTKKEIVDLLKSYLYDVEISEGKIKVIVPYLRNDIMHKYDIIEDIAIAYGYENIPDKKINFFSQGETTKKVKIINILRDYLVGFGFVETFNHVLTSKKVLFENMNEGKKDFIEIKNYVSENYSIVRNSLLPLLLEFAAKNKTKGYPQRLFEAGETTSLKRYKKESYNLAGLIIEKESNFSYLKSMIDGIGNLLNKEFLFEKISDKRFLEGRSAKILFEKKEIGIIGEIHPKVLNNFGIGSPILAFELELDFLD